MEKRPNVLFMIADDHRSSALGVNGDPIVQTPVLDALARRGVNCRRNYHMGGLSAAVCVPTRAALLTGTNPFRASVGTDMANPRSILTLDPALTLLPEQFRRAGYRTFATGKWHNDKASFARSFDDGARIFFGGMSDHDAVPLHDFDPSGEYQESNRTIGQGFSTDFFAGAAIRFLQEQDGAQPFFLYCAFTAPHDPRTPPAGYAEMYEAASIPLPPNFLPEHPFDNGELQIRDEQLADFPRTPAEVRRHIADYYGMISHLDAQIGAILQALQDNGLAENTIVVYTADHGLAVGEHGLLGKQNLYEHSVRVPLLMAGPGLPSGREVSGLTHTYDLYPTLCQLAGLPVPETVQSRSLLPLFQGGPGRTSVCSVYKDVQRMVRDDRWKLIRYLPSQQHGAGSERIQLFDTLYDPWEMRDLSSLPGQQERIEQLQTKLAEWQREVHDPLLSGPAG